VSPASKRFSTSSKSNDAFIGITVELSSLGHVAEPCSLGGSLSRTLGSSQMGKPNPYRKHAIARDYRVPGKGRDAARQL
jgi:hypothetical protein